jgi:hypothetical protein
VRLGSEWCQVAVSGVKWQYILSCGVKKKSGRVEYPASRWLLQ